MTCTEEYKEHIEYTFHAFCKVVIRNATINAARTRNRKYKREISLEYLTDEKHYPLGTADKYFQAPEPECRRFMNGHCIMKPAENKEMDRLLYLLCGQGAAPGGNPGRKARSSNLSAWSVLLLPGTVRLPQSFAPLETGLCPQNAGRGLPPASCGSLAAHEPCGISAGCAAVL